MHDMSLSNPTWYLISVPTVLSSSGIVQVVGSEEETSRLLLCEATAVVMRKCFYLLGITPVYKI